MLSPLLLSAAVLCAGVRVDVASDGSYEVVVPDAAGDKTWLSSGNASFFAAGKWFTHDDLNIATKDISGTTDTYGSYTGKSISFASRDTEKMLDIVATVKNYNGFAVMDVTYVKGINSTNSTKDIDGISSTFPSFNLVQPSGAPKLGVMAWKGTFINQANTGPRFGIYPDTAGLSTGKDGGPHMLFDDEHAVMVSAESNFMAHTFAVEDGSLAAGIIGSVTDIPAGYSISTILSGGAAGVGINNEVQAWGDRLRARYGKTWDTYNNDFTAQHLGYNTDHGAYYYYNPNGTYADAILEVKAYADKQHIPYRHMLIDSWWYFQNEGGISNWTARPGVFYKDGGDADLVRLNQETGWPFIAHNRYWSRNTVYSKANGGDYEFSADINGSYVVPLEQRFWDDLIGNGTKWGLKTYEQDWMYNEFDNTPLLRTSATQARTWLMQMGAAAQKHGVNIQYCMPYPRHAMQSLEIQAVSQIRASGDYIPGRDRSPPNWNIGGSSILAHALALRPFKDNFWTMLAEPGSSSGNTTNPDTPRAAAVATLTAAPVTPGDGAMYQNTSLIMMSTRADGVLLHPGRPCTYIDSFIRSLAGQGVGPAGHVWSTHTMVGASRFDVVFSTEVTAAYDLKLSELNVALGVRAATVAFVHDPFRTAAPAVATFDEATPLHIMPFAAEPDFALHAASAVESNGWSLLGELNKWVPVSASRFSQIGVDGDDLVATCMGSAGETVKVSFAKGGKVTTVSCTFTDTTLKVSASGHCN